VGYIFGINIAWFVSLYTHIKPIRLILVINSLYIISLLINEISPTGILYSHIGSLSSISLPWGESISYVKGILSPLFIFQILALSSNTIYCFSACYLQYRQGEKRAALTLSLSLAILVATVQSDRLVDLGKIQFVYLAEFGFLSFIIIMSLRLSKDLIQVVKLREQLLESERLRKIAVELERHRLARDLHDSVSQTLFTVATTAEALPRVWQRYPDIAEQELGELAQLTQAALAEIRSLLIELRPDGLANKPLAELLQQLIKTICERASLKVTTKIVEGDYPISNEVKLVFYRITQEALNNIIRHAQATQVSVSFYSESQNLVLRITDNGCGFESNNIPSGHLGIAIMKERADSIGASFDLESSLGKGTEIVLTVPIPK
jgi:signal transduction histidine kinase